MLCQYKTCGGKSVITDMISFFGQRDSLGHLIQSSEHHRIGRIECCRTGLGAMKCSCGKWQVTFYKSTSSSFHAFGSHQFIKDSALLLLNPLKHLPLYLFSFSESDFNPAHYISVLPNNPKENVILTYWMEKKPAHDRLFKIFSPSRVIPRQQFGAQ